jgi:hypothetical protein
MRARIGDKVRTIQWRIVDAIDEHLEGIAEAGITPDMLQTEDQIYAQYAPGYHKVSRRDFHIIGLGLGGCMSPGGYNSVASRQTLLQWAKKGRIHYFVSGGYVMIPEKSVKAWLASEAFKRSQFWNHGGRKKNRIDEVTTTQ